MIGQIHYQVRPILYLVDEADVVSDVVSVLNFGSYYCCYHYYYKILLAHNRTQPHVVDVMCDAAPRSAALGQYHTYPAMSHIHNR